MERLIVFSPADVFQFEIADGDVFECVRTDELNGEHSLSITTTKRLEQAQRVLLQDGQGLWHEYVVTAPDELHDAGASAIGTYWCTWSVQYDLSVVYGPERRPGVQGSEVPCATALAAALDGTKRWTVGRCDVTSTGGVMMYNNSAWERIADVIAEYGGELDVRISVDNTKITKREVILYDQQGSSMAKRRFDWGRDTSSIRRTPTEGARVCRVIPIGAPIKPEKVTISGKIPKSEVTKLANQVTKLTNKLDKLTTVTIPNAQDNKEKQQRKFDNAVARLDEIVGKYGADSPQARNALVAFRNAETDLRKADRTLQMYGQDERNIRNELAAAQTNYTNTKNTYDTQQAQEADAQKKAEQAQATSELYGSQPKQTIVDVNSGLDYVQDNEAAAAFRVPDGSGGWEYPTCMVENSKIEDATALLAWAQEHLHEWTRPTPTYDAKIDQYAAAGMDVRGVALGDVVHVVDKGFSPDAALRLEARIVRIETNELDRADVKLTIGALRPGLGESQRILQGKVKAATARLDVMYRSSGGSISTAQYLEQLLNGVNDKLNATDGYAYMVPGEGIICYDKAVSDPSVGSEASRVIQLIGGALRIASSRTATGEWDWQVVMTAEDGILAEAVTAANITTGFIGSPSGNFWNLDTGQFRMMGNVELDDDGTTIQDVMDDTADAVRKAEAAIRGVDVEYYLSTSALEPTGGQWSTDSPTWTQGKYIWQRTVAVASDGTRTYSDPTCIQGAQGEAGLGIRAIVEQYYLSTSNTTQTGGSWSTAQPAWSSGKYIWTRSQVTWSNNSVTYTDPVLAKAINGANEVAAAAKAAQQTFEQSLNAEKVFNLLTNNGAIQGIERDASGNLYINGTYIRAGTISTDVIKTKDGRTSWAQVGNTAYKTPGMTLYSGSLPYFSVTSLSAVGQSNTTGVGFLTKDGVAFMDADRYWGSTMIYPPVGGQGTQAFMNKPSAYIEVRQRGSNKENQRTTITSTGSILLMTPELRISESATSSTHSSGINGRFGISIPTHTRGHFAGMGKGFSEEKGNWTCDKPIWKSLILEFRRGICTYLSFI